MAVEWREVHRTAASPESRPVCPLGSRVRDGPARPCATPPGHRYRFHAVVRVPRAPGAARAGPGEQNGVTGRGRVAGPPEPGMGEPGVAGPAASGPVPNLRAVDEPVDEPADDAPSPAAESPIRSGCHGAGVAEPGDPAAGAAERGRCRTGWLAARGPPRPRTRLRRPRPAGRRARARTRDRRRRRRGPRSPDSCSTGTAHSARPTSPCSDALVARAAAGLHTVPPLEPDTDRSRPARRARGDGAARRRPRRERRHRRRGGPPRARRAPGRRRPHRRRRHRQRSRAGARDRRTRPLIWLDRSSTSPRRSSTAPWPSRSSAAPATARAPAGTTWSCRSSTPSSSR